VVRAAFEFACDARAFVAERAVVFAVAAPTLDRGRRPPVMQNGRSGGAVARPGVRTMPTFPSPYNSDDDDDDFDE